VASHPRDLVRRVALGLTVLLVAGALSFPAAADTAFTPDGPRTFRAGVTTDSGGSTTYTLTLTNTATGNKTLGSANITIPGFTIASENLSWSRGSAALVGGVIELRGLDIGPDARASVTFGGSFDEDACAFAIGIDARQANDFRGTGNALSLFGPSPVLVPEGCDASQRLEFSVQPGDAMTGDQVPGNTTPPSSPTVRLVNAAGEVVTSATGPVSMMVLPAEANQPPPPSFTGSSTTQVGLDMGVATFTNLEVIPGGFGYKLRATAGDGLTVDSTSFNVYDDVCAPPEICTSTIGEDKTFSATATGTPGLDGGGLILNVGGAAPGTGDCTVPSGVKVTRIPPVGIVATGVGLTDKLLTLTLDRSYDKSVADNDGVAHYQVCARSSEPTSEFSLFTDRYGNEVSLGSWGYLPDCRDNGDRPPCVLSRTKSQGGFPVITLRWGSKITLR
jgi:hypothetical protein